MAAIATAKLGPDGCSCIKFRQDLTKAIFSATDKYTSPTGYTERTRAAATTTFNNNGGSKLASISITVTSSMQQ